MLHGEAISLGTRAALRISEKHGGLSREASLAILKALDRFQLPLVLAESIRTETVMEKLATDKKFSAGAIRFVVLDQLGSAKVTSAVTADNLMEAIDHLRTAPSLT